ncbi:MAG TPA: S8 family serine peptidase [Pyrinomonadaceae bacterium]|nr:S8 family serine peptidase [Pyrinomonadaceae bacterium]
MITKRAGTIGKQLFVCVVCLALTHTLLQPSAANSKHRSVQSGISITKLRKVDRERLIAAKLQRKNEIMLVLAAKTGTNAAVAREVTMLGAAVRFREDTVDYLRVRVPIERVDEVARLNNIQVMAIDGVQMYDTSHDMPVSQLQKTSSPDANTPAENPFLPTADIGAPQFIRDHPTFDGRGVTIASVDGNSPDILAPELQTALSIDGAPVPKFSDVINSLDPIDDESPFRVDMSNEVEARDGRFELKQIVYQTPANGKYRLGFFDINAFGDGLLRTYLPELPKEKKLLPVLWQEPTNLVWVDTNFNQSFTDETALTDFNSSYRAGVLGTDDPTTPLREIVAFTILTNAQHKLIYLAPLANAHATGTASVAAGHNFFGGKMSGVAPGARIASVLRKSLTHSFVEAMILTIKNPKVDVVSLQWAALMPPQDGNSVVGIIFERLIDRYKKPIFSSANNSGPGVSTHGEQAASSKVVSVGAYINKLTWQSNFGVSPAANDTVPNLSARGPRVDGGFKPDLVAPAAAVSANFGLYDSRTPAPFSLPPGYGAGAGTSFSCPMAAGATALLISAAKQSGVPYDAARIAWALKTSARYLSGARAHEQGNGLIDVRAAWEALKRAPEPVAISSSAQISVAAGPYLKTPNFGPGIFEREGWRSGQSGQRTITFTRSSGSNYPMDYVVRWLGNDGAFSSATKIRLPLNKPVHFPVTINVKNPGVHSAILNLDDDTNGARSVYQVMNTVIAAEQFTPSQTFTVTREDAAEYPAYTSYFFNVPENASAFKLDLKIRQGTVRLRLMRPTGKEFDEAHDTPVRWRPEYQTGGNMDRIIVEPEPGVWEVIVENQNLLVLGDSETRRARFLITATVYGAECKSLANQLTTRVRKVLNRQQVQCTDRLAAFNGSFIETQLASAFSTRIVIADETDPLIYEINVPEGAGTLKARINGPSTKTADVDLYLYFCPKECELRAFSARSGIREQVLIAQPKGGKWKVVVDPVSIGSGPLLVDYLDIFTHAAFGSLTPLNPNITLAKGTSSRTGFVTKIDALPVNSRHLVGVVQLMARDLATVRYEYNANTKTVEPVKERVALAETLVEP